MNRGTLLTGLGLGAAAGFGIAQAARRIAFASPNPALAARAREAQYSGPWRHGFADVNGVRLHYAEMGNGPLVILLHGFPECWYEWHYVMPRLAQRFHVVAPDMRGYNMSDKPQGIAQYTIEKLGQDVAALIEALGEERAHVVGHDWGGAVAWHVGIHHGDHVEKLAVINAPHPVAFQRELRKLRQLVRSYYIFLFQLPVLPEAAMRLTLRRSLAGTAAVPGSFPQEALDVYENNISLPGAVTAMLNYYRAAVRQSLRLVREESRVITRPTLLLWGMKDFALLPELTEGLETWVPNLHIEREPDSGHWVPEERPGWVADRLAEFFS